MFSQSHGAKLEFGEIKIGWFMLHACHLASVMKLHADLDEIASVHAALFPSEGLHKENIVYHKCIWSSVF